MPTKIIRGAEMESIQTGWGNFRWLVSRKNGASDNMTVGRVTFAPGQSNPHHFHPDCEEVLYVVNGEIEHVLPEGGSVRLHPGDCIVLPAGAPHRAENVGNDEAVVLVVFNSADRRTVETGE